MQHAVGAQYCEMTKVLSDRRRKGSALSGFLLGVSNSASSFTNALVYWYVHIIWGGGVGGCLRVVLNGWNAPY